MAVWVVRAGRGGEDEDWNLSQGRAGVGFAEVASLQDCHSREDIRALVDATFPNDPPGRRSTAAAQLWAIRGSMQPGDMIIMPLKRSGLLAFGTCTARYSYDAAQPDARRRHHIRVNWQPEHVSRTALKDDLLNTINGALTVFSPSRNNAAARLAAVASHGQDPGSNTTQEEANGRPAPPPKRATPVEEPNEELVDPLTLPTFEAIRDRIRNHIVENFTGHKLTHLVADILHARGFVCQVSPEGADGGIDILAGTGPLGLDDPTLAVEVKSELGTIGATVVRGLQGAMTAHTAKQGLVVAWGGFKATARSEFYQKRTMIRFWDAEDILDQIFEVYPQLSSETKARLPLKQVWVLDEETG